MIKRKNTIFFTLILIAILSFIFSSQALADLTTIYPSTGQTYGTELILNPVSDFTTTDMTLELELLDAEQVVARRLAHLDLPEPYQVVQRNGQLIVTLPQEANTLYVNSVIAHVGEVQFIDGGTTAPSIGQRVNFADEAVYQSLFTGQDVQEIVPPDVANGQIFYEIILNPETADRFAEFANSQTGHSICIVMDQEVVSCSAMYHWADGSLEIIPNLSSGSVINLSDLAIFLESGPLPMPMRIQE